MVIALHYGSAIYGNIGAADRLDFTVIGPDVNLVSRIEAVAKSLDLPLVVSDDFARVFMAGSSSRSACTSCAASSSRTNCSRCWKRTWLRSLELGGDSLTGSHGLVDAC